MADLEGKWGVDKEIDAKGIKEHFMKGDTEVIQFYHMGKGRPLM